MSVWLSSLPFYSDLPVLAGTSSLFPHTTFFLNLLKKVRVFVWQSPARGEKEFSLLQGQV
jgi:hypothetical protein